MSETLALPDLLRHAGAVMTQRDDHPVPAHYGSAPGELAVCVQAVGLALRSDLVALSVAGSSASLDRLVERELGHSLAPGGAALEAGAWWCRTPDELVFVARRATADRLARALRHNASRIANSELTERPDVILNVIGRRTASVLEALGVCDDPRAVPPFSVRPVLDHHVSWLLQADVSALALVEPASAGAIWQAVDDAGRPRGISCVGIESIDRYMLTERAKRSGVTLL